MGQARSLQRPPRPPCLGAWRWSVVPHVVALRAGARAILIPVLITLDVPHEFASPLLPAGQDPARAALEAIAVEAYRQRRISGYQLRILLGIPTRYELDGFLKQHEVYDYTIEDFENDLASVRELDKKRKAEQLA